MKKYKVIVGCDYFQGHLKYGHGETIIEAETEDEAIDKVLNNKDNLDLKPVVDSYEIEDHADWDFDALMLEKIKEGE